jgi:protease-4
MDRREVLKVADGRVFTGRQALESGLVDTLGYFDDAVSLAGRMAGIEGEPEIVRERPRRITWLDLLLEETRTLLQNRGGYALKYSWQAPF